MPTNKKNTRGIGGSGKRQEAHGTSYFFGIGINAYQDKHFRNLNNAVKDVQDMAALLQARYEVDEVKLLLNEEATRQNIIIELDRLEELIEPVDKLIIYYSGHGHLNTKSGHGFWIPTNAGKAHTDQYIRNSAIRDYIQSIKSRHTLLISDSCFSGALFVRSASRGSTTAIDKLESSISRWALCSGRSDELVDDGPAGGNSPFASSILEVLQENQLQRLNVGKIIDRVMELTSAEADQVPEGNPLKGVGHRGGQYVFVLKVEEDNLWQKARQENKLTPLMDYVEQYPRGKYRKEAIQQIDAREKADAAAWQAIENQESLARLLTYLDDFPDGKFVKIANDKIAALKTGRLSTATPTPIETLGIFIDPRDGQQYRTVTLNGQIWLAENLNYDVGNGCWIYKKPSGFLSLGDKMVEGYGRLYTWEAAKKACPPGWRLPTDEEWKSLALAYGGYYDRQTSKYIGDPKKSYQALIQGGSSGFLALLGGWRHSIGSYTLIGSLGYYWSSTESDADDAWCYDFSRGKLNRFNSFKSHGFSCRCLKD